MSERIIDNFYFNKPFSQQNCYGYGEIYVMIGIPGGGKDTYIEQHKCDCDVVICRDDIRAELGLCKQGDKIVGTSEQEKKVTEIFNERLVNAAKEGKTIWINNTNLKRKYRDLYKNLIYGRKYDWIYVYSEAPSLDKNREVRNGQIPDKVFEDMINGFEWPYRDEYTQLIINKWQ
jgi:predicted kinase